jgi:hypothetical protein
MDLIFPSRKKIDERILGDYTCIAWSLLITIHHKQNVTVTSLPLLTFSPENRVMLLWDTDPNSTNNFRTLLCEG